VSPHVLCGRESVAGLAGRIALACLQVPRIDCIAATLMQLGWPAHAHAPPGLAVLKGQQALNSTSRQFMPSPKASPGVRLPSSQGRRATQSRVLVKHCTLVLALAIDCMVVLLLHCVCRQILQVLVIMYRCAASGRLRPYDVKFKLRSANAVQMQCKCSANADNAGHMRSTCLSKILESSSMLQPCVYRNDNQPAGV
jgi:hypothetical protein